VGTGRIDLTEASYVDHHVAWLPRQRADELLVELRREVTWERREIVLFGKRIFQPRLVGWGGDLPYRYSGQTLPPRPLPDVALSCIDEIAARTGIEFNHVLFNLYRDGDDSMGMHADDEPELGEYPCVASLSLGQSRRFVLKARRGRASVALSLGHGDLLVMRGKCQTELVHGIPRQRAATGERLSLTLRRVFPERPALAPPPRRG